METGEAVGGRRAPVFGQQGYQQTDRKKRRPLVAVKIFQAGMSDPPSAHRGEFLQLLLPSFSLISSSSSFTSPIRSFCLLKSYFSLPRSNADVWREEVKARQERRGSISSPHCLSRHTDTVSQADERENGLERGASVPVPLDQSLSPSFLFFSSIPLFFSPDQDSRGRKRERSFFAVAFLFFFCLSGCEVFSPRQSRSTD